MKVTSSSCKSLRAFSITTRIKTPNSKHSWILLVLWEHFPLQQGLRRDNCCWRLKPHVRLWGHFPLKQGLRPVKIYNNFTSFDLWEHFPLKQGLRRILFSSLLNLKSTLRAFSIITRIKTSKKEITVIYLMGTLRALSITTRIIKKQNHN